MIVGRHRQFLFHPSLSSRIFLVLSLPSVWLAMSDRIFFRRLTIAINTPLERSWAQNSNRSSTFTIEQELSELQQVIVWEYSGANRFLWPGIFVNSSTAPYCIAMERQKQNEMVWTHNLINSRNNGERKGHIDDGERPSGTTNDGDEQSTIY